MSLTRHPLQAWSKCAALAGLLLVVGGASARDIPVSNAADVAAAAARAAPGDVLVMSDGEWRDQVVIFEAQGREGAPIRLRARTPGQVVLSGSSRLEIGGRHLEVAGLRFERGGLRQGLAVVAFRTRRQEASDSRFIDSAIVGYNPPDPETRYSWVALYGQRNRVDHNLFEGQRHSGPTVAVVREVARRDEHRIDHNHFLDRPPGADRNGYESIRIGTSKVADSDSGTVVERNLFERTNGEIEAVSVKSGGNLIRDNTFLEVQGSITLRNGSGNTVSGNVFIGDGVPGTGGIRVMGAGHVITGNLLQGLSAATGGAITLNCGHADAATRAAANDPVFDVRIEGNQVIDQAGPAINAEQGCGTLGRSVAPERLVIAGNRVSGGKAALLAGATPGASRLEGNSVLPPSPSAAPAATDVALRPLRAAEVGPAWRQTSR
ncbi:MAG: right-handed parallel beta-helix repeat-containing protein [Burkholderiaceae bacterium]|nr:polysaccharide lyase 6 family protein [Rhodoferax sp.]MCP5285817.1 right-handed parallel beta-helix repeat-containing protein [Burkholderiaceae bacterium]